MKPSTMSRRGFLRLLGITATTVILGGGEPKVEAYTMEQYYSDLAELIIETDGGLLGGSKLKIDSWVMRTADKIQRGVHGR